MTALALSQILQFGMTVFLKVPELIAAGRDVSAIFSATGEKIKVMVNENRGPTPEEWDSMNAMIAALREELHSPDA